MKKGWLDANPLHAATAAGAEKPARKVCRSTTESPRARAAGGTAES